MDAKQEAQLTHIAADVVQRARKAGADLAEATVREGSHLSVKVRMREPELVEEAGSRAIGLRVMIGQQVAVSYTSDLTARGVENLVSDAIELAKLSQPDDCAGAPDAHELCDGRGAEQLQLFDAKMSALDAAEALERAREGEAAAFAYDARIVNSEGSSFSRMASASTLVTSSGFRGTYDGTYASLVVRPIAEDRDDKKRRGYHWTARRHLAELDPGREVGEEAARRTLRQLGAQKVATCEVPVIFESDAARSILSLLAGCLLGSSIWRKASYLVDREGTQVASDLVTVVDDPLIPKAPGSRPFDGEGIASRATTVVERGVLRTYLLDTYCARKLGRAAGTASASRNSNGGVAPSTSNFVLQPGKISREALVQGTQRALYVTEMMGFGFNAVTGDFSRGASGYWLEDGELKFPVSEVTISLNVDELFKRIDAVADDLDLRTSTACPTFRVSGMTVAGK